jgi:branched-chain amino acid transport system ATP-binding protein
LRVAVSGDLMQDGPLLRLDDVSKNFGALRVSRNVNLTLEKGARHALIGPNGAGKTTLVNLISGVLRPTSGRIYIGSVDVTRAFAEERVRLGLVRTFQINSLFPKLTVAENVALGVSAHARRDWRPWGEMRGERKTLQTTEGILASTGLAAHAGAEVAKLAYGQQRLVEIALALALEPKILVLDEPAAGLSGAEREALLALLFKLPEQLAVLIIEHDMSLVFRLAQKISVLVEGGILVEGTAEEVRNNPQVRDVYLGHRSHG